MVFPVFWAALVFGAQPYEPVRGDPMLESWRWRVLPELNGVGFRCMAEGSSGDIWFGTTEGVFRYDGIQWTSFGKQDGLGRVEALCASKDGAIFAGGQWGLARFSQGRWQPLLNSPESFGGIKQIMQARDGALWVATGVGVLRQAGGKFVVITGSEGAGLVRTNSDLRDVQVELLPPAILSSARGTNTPPNRSDYFEVYEDREGRIWLGSEAGEILCFEPGVPAGSNSNTVTAPVAGAWTLYGESAGVVLSRRSRILQLDNGVIWAVSWGALGRAYQFDGTNWHGLRLSDHGVPDDCTSLLQTQDGSLWFGCNGAVGALSEGKWRVYEAPKVPIPTVRTILMQSKDGALWIGGQDAEVLRMDYQTPGWLTYQNLNFYWESPQGAQWFLDRNGRVVVRDGNHWTSYGPEDGLIDNPTTLVGTRSGDVWVAGSHEHTAASARFDGRQWTRSVHEQMSWAVDWRAVFESSDGSLWFGATVDSSGLGKIYQDGLMQYHQGEWTHHKVVSSMFGQNTTTLAPGLGAGRDPIGKFYGIGETRDGKVWAGQYVLTYYETNSWHIFDPGPDLLIGTIEGMFTSRNGDLWIGSRSHGAFRYDGRQWRRYHVKDGLVANTVRGIAETADGNIWAATDRGISCFDGQTWNPTVLPAELNMPREGGTLRASPSGALWINRSSRAWTRRAWPKSPPFDPAAGEFWTVCYRMDRNPPHTAITAGLNKVSQPGNLMIAWTGTDRWQETRDADLQFSFRLDGGPWSPFTVERTHSFFSLRRGQHHFEVRARDHSMNVDPAPAALDFEVVPPVWRQAWFIALLSLLTGAIVAQTLRVIRNGRHLRQTNLALSAEVEERKRIEAEMESTHKQLLVVSRQAGMAEVAVNVLHNVGNVLNSVNVSANLLGEKIRKSKAAELPRLTSLVATQTPKSDFLMTHEKGRLIPEYLERLSGHLTSEQRENLTEISRMQKNIDHITNIIVQQQEHSRFADLDEMVKVTELVEDALRLKAGELTRHHIQLVRDFQEPGPVMVKKFKVIEILADLLRESQHACRASGRADPQLTIRTLRPAADRVRIQVLHNGIGLPLENREKIFAQDFQAGGDGHHPNLHNSANRALELGGSLTVDSDGTGACFTLEFPANPKPKTS